MVMGLVSGLSLANHSDSESFLVVHAYFRPDGCQREGFWEVVGYVGSPLDLSQTSSSNKWRLSSSMFLTRRSCHKTTPAKCYSGAWPGWMVSNSALALTPWSLEPSLFSWRGKSQQAAEKSWPVLIRTRWAVFARRPRYPWRGFVWRTLQHWTASARRALQHENILYETFQSKRKHQTKRHKNNMRKLHVQQRNKNLRGKKKEQGETPRLYQHKKMEVFKVLSQKTLKRAKFEFTNGEFSETILEKNEG